MKGQKKTVGRKIQENVNHSVSRCGRGWRTERKSMGKYEQPAARESTRRGEQEREAAAERVKRVKARDEETDNKWDDAPHDGLPQACAATWNYITKNRSSRGGGGVVH